MNQIIKSFLTTHIKEYGLEKIKESTAFEHFINRIIINKYSCGISKELYFIVLVFQ